MLDSLPAEGNSWGRRRQAQPPPTRCRRRRLGSRGCSVRLGTPGSVRERQKGFEEEPFGIGKVGLVCFSHARYPTEPRPQTPFSDGFITKFRDAAF